MKTIGEHWTDFEIMARTNDMSDEKIAALKDSFYAGALSIMIVIKTIKPGMSEDAGTAILHGLDAEIKQYAVDRVLGDFLGADAKEILDRIRHDVSKERRH